MSKARFLKIALVLLFLVALPVQRSFGQAFGVSLQANLMPASGGMGGASIARPQDLQSSLAINPATLTQRKGTQFSFSGAWVEPTINVDQKVELPLANIQPFKSKSQRPGSIVGNIGVTQDFTALGLNATAGIGLLTASGLGINYRNVTESNGSTAELTVLGTGAGIGIEVTDRLSLGFEGIVATTSMDGVFSGVAASTPDYNLRAMLGFTYDVRDQTTIGGYWHTKQKHTFDDFIRIGGPNAPFADVKLALPNVYGLGIADQSLVDGRLLLAIDFGYLEWSEADFFGDVWEDQFTLQTGMQYTTCRGIQLRAGYVYADNASKNVVAGNVGGVSPQAGVNFIQSLFPNINKHRITGGIGVKDMLPGVDVDLFAGGMFNETQDFGDTAVSVESYWVGFGTTWRFGRGGCKHLNVPDRW